MIPRAWVFMDFRKECMMGLIRKIEMDIPDNRRRDMKREFLALPALTLAIEICAFGLLLGGNGILAGDSAPQGSQQPSAVKTSTEKNAWTIGIYTGPSPFQLSPPANIRNPVLTAADVNDLAVDIVAHPFMVITDSAYYLFFTAKDGKTDKGGIGLAESRDGLHWKYRRTVIHEPFVLSHPYVFKWQNDYYMIPEGHTETSVRLYRATEFPAKWEYERDLLKGDHFISPTVVRYKDMWWMFVARSGNETLRLFYAPDLKKPWTEHPLSPIVRKDLNTARPGGRPFVIDGALYRLGQDCYPTYGNQVRAFKVTDISPTTYSEVMMDTPLVKFSAKGWNAEAMHHVDVHQTGKYKWIAAVDALGRNP
jgi:hypothetical protein